MLSFFHHAKNQLGNIQSAAQRRSKVRTRRKIRLFWNVESLENRTLLTTYTVMDTSDDINDTSSLRYAINQANTNPGADTIQFDQNAFSTPQVITLGGTELLITDSVTITGPGALNLTINANAKSRIFDAQDGVLFPGKDVAISGLTLTGGYSSGRGGAIFSGENLTLTDDVLTGNFAVGDKFNNQGGGAVFEDGRGGNLFVDGCTFSNNSCTAPGGAISATMNTATSVTIQNSTIESNTAFASFNGKGGGIAINSQGARVLIQNSTITNNSANSAGGISLYIDSPYASILEGLTIVGNHADSTPTDSIGGLAMFTSTGTTTLRDSIVSGNTSSSTTKDVYVGHGFNGNNLITHSLIGNNSGSGLTESQTPDANGNLVGSSANPIDPKLDPLADNGGPTETMKPQDGSKVIGAGAHGGTQGVPTVDQRGVARPTAGFIDIGAYQTPFVDLSPTTPSNLALTPGTDTGVKGDNITSNTTPTITGNADTGNTITLYESFPGFQTSLGTTTAAGGTWSIPITLPLGLGPHVLVARADNAGNLSAFSNSLTITIAPVDTTPPNPPALLTLDPASDSGVQGDNITEETLPTITGTAEADSTVTLKDGTQIIGVATATGGVWSITPTQPLSLGAHTFKATATDAAGNTSLPSAGLTVTIVAPAPTTDTGTVGTSTPPSFYKPPVEDNSTFVVDVAPGALDTLKGTGSFTVNLPIDRYFGDITKLRAAGLLPSMVTLQLPAFDVDSNGLPVPERDRISINGHSFQGVNQGEFLTGLDGTWRLNTFTIPIDFLNFPSDLGVNGTLVPANNQIKIDVDTTSVGWQTSIDWISLKVPAPNPVFLAPGLLVNASDWNTVWVPQLTALGVPIGTADLTGVAPNQTIDTIANGADKIAVAIAALQQRWGFKNITIVGESLGAIDAREYIGNLMNDADPTNDGLVSQLIEIGAPNGGTSISGNVVAEYLSFAAQLGFAGLPPFMQISGAPQLSPAFMANYNATHPLNPNTTYWSLASNYQAPTSDVTGHFLESFAFGQPSDTVVTQQSAWTTIDPSHRLSYQSPNGDAQHFAVGSVVPGIIASQGIFNELLPLVLRNNEQVQSPFSASPNALTAQLIQPLDTEQPDTMPGTATVSGLTGILGTNHHTLILDGGHPAYVTLFDYLGNLDVTLTSPSGVVISPNDPGVSFEDEETSDHVRMLIYQIASPEAGNWTVTVHNNSIIPEPYLINGWFPESTLTLASQVDKTAYATGDPILLTASVSDGTNNVAGATVTAQVFDPSYVEHDVTLFDDGSPNHGDSVAGDGVYSNLYTQTANPGFYQILVKANGTVPTAFDRQTQVTTEVGHVTAELNNSFTDSTIDTDENGLSDQLVIQAGITVTAPGFYRVMGELRDSNNQVVGEASFAGNLTPSDQQVALKFDGRDIFESGSSGPFTLSSISLAQDTDDVTVPIQDLTPNYQTAAYTHSSFEHGSIEVTGVDSETAVDSSSPPNGKFDALNISVDVTVAVSGQYSFSANLVDAMGHVVASDSGTASLASGTNTIAFSFPGAMIGGSRDNGPYRLTNLVISSDTDGAVVSQEFSTQTYQASQFEGFLANIPTNLVLAPASDTGRLANDNFTGDTTPTLTVTADPGTAVKFHVNGIDVTATESTPGVYTATFAAGVLHVGSNSVTATSTNSAGTSPASTPLVIQLAETRTLTVATGTTLSVTQPDGTVVKVTVQGALASATVTVLANDQFGEIGTITYKTSKSKSKNVTLQVTATGGQGFVNTITSNTSILTSLSLTNVTVGHIQVNGSLTTLNLTAGNFTGGLTATGSVTTINAGQLVLSSTINIAGSLGTAKFAGAVAGSAINATKSITTLEFDGNNNTSLSSKKVKTITSHGTMDGTYQVKTITTITSTGVFHVKLGTSKVSHLTAPPG
ncbi:MAG: hypothetical protein JWM11_4540 [Planctomycetaceae bacterium]|nr:hypothetical protein [Planctomycetaceae bacterium]